MRNMRFIVNGEEVQIEVSVSDTVDRAKAMALAESRNTGRPPADWEIRDGSGNLVDGTFPVSAFEDDIVLYLTLPIGAGG